MCRCWGALSYSSLIQVEVYTVVYTDIHANMIALVRIPNTDIIDWSNMDGKSHTYHYMDIHVCKDGNGYVYGLILDPFYTKFSI